ASLQNSATRPDDFLRVFSSKCNRRHSDDLSSAQERKNLKPGWVWILRLPTPTRKSRVVYRESALVSQPRSCRFVRIVRCIHTAKSQLYIRAKGQQATVTILHDKLSRVPGHIRELARKLNAPGCILGIKRVRIFNKEVCVEQLIRILVRISYGRPGTAKMNRSLITRHNGVDRRILPRSQTLKSQLLFIVGKRGRYIESEEYRCDLADHRPSVLQCSIKFSYIRTREAKKNAPICQIGALPVLWNRYCNLIGWAAFQSQSIHALYVVAVARAACH